MQVSSTSGVLITDMDRLYDNLDEFTFTPLRQEQNFQSLLGQQAEQNVVDTCRFFLTARSKASELNLFNLPRVAMWPLWNNSSSDTAFDSEIRRCSTVAATGSNSSAVANPHQMAFFRSTPLNGTTDATIQRNQQVFGYLEQLMNNPVPGIGRSFTQKYGQSDSDQILAEIMDYIRCTNLADNSAGATPYTPTSISQGNVTQVGQVVPLQMSATMSGMHQGMGRIGTIAEMALALVKVDDRADITKPESNTNLTQLIKVTGGGPNITTVNPKTQTLLEWALIPRFDSPMCGYVAMANNMMVKFSNFQNFSIGGFNITNPTVSTIYDMGRLSGINRDSVMGGLIGAESMVEEQEFGSEVAAPASSAYPTGLVVVSGTTQTGGVAGPITVKGSFTATIYAPYNSSTPLQTFNFALNSPGTSSGLQVPIPNLYLASSGTWEGTFRAPGGPNGAYSGGTTSATFAYPASIGAKSALARYGFAYNTFLSGTNIDVVRSLSPTGPLATSSSIGGDIRLVAMSGTIPTSTFVETLGSGGVTPSGTTFVANSLRLGTLISAAGESNGTLVGSLKGTVGYNPEVPPQVSGSVPASGPFPGSGDWDNGPGEMVDGPWCNKPDEGMTGNTGQLPYIGFYETMTETGAPIQSNFSPNRQVSSPVMFGSLPVGLDHPWRTLLFRPDSLPGYQGVSTGYKHPGNATPQTQIPDHLLLDLFWMPVVEPYAISEPLATSGKINLNTQIAPFTYITRTTGLQAVLKSVMITALNPNPSTQNNWVKSEHGAYASASYPKVVTRYPIDTDQTVRQLTTSSPDATAAYPEFSRTSHSPANPNFFVSASQICDVPLIPMGYTGGPSGNLSSFWSVNGLTGDNSLERPYSLIYPRVTTKSNVYTVHVIAQSLKQTPKDASQTGGGVWTEGVDQVTGEYRGSFTVERYYDPNSTDITTNQNGGILQASFDKSINPTTAAIRGAKWRTLYVKRFGQ